MGILQITTDETGEVGQLPRTVKIVTTDALAVVTAAGYLNPITLLSNTIYPSDVINMIYSWNAATQNGTYAVFRPSFTGSTITLVEWANPGEVALPVTANHIAVFTNTTGTIGDDPATAINGGNIQAGLAGTAGTLISFPATAANGSLIISALNAGGAFNTTIRNSAMLQSTVYSIPDAGAATANFIVSGLAGAGVQHITSGSLQVDAGGLLAGLAAGGTAGSLTLYPATTANGSLILSPLNAGGAFNTTVRNSVMGQSSVISIPDPGAATANFLLSTGASNIIAKQEFVGINSVLTFGTGTWTLTRIAQGDYVQRHTAGDETSIIAVDITPVIVAAASKGFRLDSFDYIYSIGTLAMDAHSVTLDRIDYANNVAVAVTSIALTGSLATATQANPYVTNIAVTTPAFDVTADSKYVMEITADNSATSAYDFYGVMLRFSQTIA